jgi:hypothetical protein
MHHQTPLALADSAADLGRPDQGGHRARYPDVRGEHAVDRAYRISLAFLPAALEIGTTDVLAVHKQSSMAK